MKKTKYLNKTLIGIIGTLGLGGAAVGGGILAYTNANVDQLDVLTRAVRDNTVEQYKARAPGDVIVATNENHVGAIIDNNLYMWGHNDQSQLGLGDTNPRNLPTLVPNISDGITERPLTGNITQIALGRESSGAVIDGKLYMWGSNSANQLGLGGNSAIIPTLVKNVSDAGVVSNLTGNISKISFGIQHSAAIINDKLYTWGKGSGLGLSANQLDANIPTLVQNTEVTEGAPITPIIDAVTHLSLGMFSSSAVIGGKLYTWGYNYDGQLGIDGVSRELYTPTLVSEISDGTNPPVPLTGIITQISINFSHGGVVIDNKLYTWGQNTEGELGNGSNGGLVKIPTLVKNTQVGNNAPNPITSNVTEIYMGSTFSAAVIGGKLYTWGLNRVGSLGIGTTGNSENTPTLVENISDGINPPVPLTGIISQISLGGESSIAVIDKKVYTWGRNHEGQLGLGDNSNRNIPTEVSFFIEKEITLNGTTDPNNVRNDFVYNIPEAKLEILINSLKNEIGIPASDTSYNISPNRKNIGTFDATTTGQIILEIKSLPSNTAFRVKLNGFLPVNLTENVKIPSQALTTAGITDFANDEINKLVEDAKNDGVNSRLAKWIIDNQLLFIGDTTTKYTADFPKDAKITKINNVAVVDGTKGEISFQIEVGKYYKQATPATDLIESTTTDPNLTVISPITLTGFKITGASKPVAISTSSRNFTAKQLLLDLFEYKSDTNDIIGDGLVKLKEYIDLTSFDLVNTKFRIKNPTLGDKKLTFEIAADRYYDDKGIVKIDANYNTFPMLTIDNLLGAESKIEKITGHPSLPASRILSDIGYDPNNPTKPITGNGLIELKKYVTDLDNFPQQPTTSFTLTHVNDKVTGQLSFEVVASNQYNSSGNATGTPLSSGILDFSNLPLAVTTEIKVKTNYKKDILSGDLEKALNFNQNKFNQAEMEKYVDFIGVSPTTAYTYADLDRSIRDTIKFNIIPSATESNGILDPAPRKFSIKISGLRTIPNSLDGQFKKTTITGPGADIAAEINTNITNGITINPNSTTWSLWNKLVDVSIYPPNTEFTIDRITSNNHGGVFTTFEIAVTANKHYSKDQTMTTDEARPPFTIDNLKFDPTSVSKTTQALPDIKANEFLNYINHNNATGSFDAAKLQEFVTFTSFDLSTPGTTTKLFISNNIIDDKIPLTFKVLNYVDGNGDGKNVPTYFDLDFILDLKATVLPPVTPGTSDSIGTTDKPTETMILATSIAGGVFLLFLLLLLLLLLIRRKRHMAEHYMIVSQKNNESGNRTRSNNKKEKRNKGNGEYDQFWIDHQEDLRRSNRKKD